MTDKEKLMIMQVMSDFDFPRVEKAMNALNWLWRKEDIPELLEVPDIGRIRDLARNILIEAVKKNTVIETGGFSAEYKDGLLTLRFILCESCADINEDILEG